MGRIPERSFQRLSLAHAWRNAPSGYSALRPQWHGKEVECRVRYISRVQYPKGIAPWVAYRKGHFNDFPWPTHGGMPLRGIPPCDLNGMARKPNAVCATLVGCNTRRALHHGSHTGKVISTTFPGPRMAECPFGVFRHATSMAWQGSRM